MRTRSFLTLLLSFWIPASLSAQSTPKYSQNVIITAAGRDWIFPPQGGPATAAPLGNVTSLALDSAGLLYLADPQNNVVLRIDSAGNISAFAGNGIQGFSGEGGFNVAGAFSGVFSGLGSSSRLKSNSSTSRHAMLCRQRNAGPRAG